MNLQEIAELKTELQSLGVRVEADSPRREGGAGPAEGITLIIDGIPATVPTIPRLAVKSPYSLKEKKRKFELFQNDIFQCEVQLGGAARFYDEPDAQGRSLRLSALLHGKDCLATTVNQVCAYYARGEGCRFCGIGISLERGRTVAFKDPETLARAARKAKELDGVTHVTLTTGTQDTPDRGIAELARAARAIKEVAGLPVHAQALPPEDLSWLRHLADHGVDTLGIHIETFAPKVRRQISISKGEMGLSRFIEAWKTAVEIFGRGQVSSYLIVGLGEEDEDVTGGADLLAGLGVYPFIVSFRPIPGTPLENFSPPPPQRMKKIYLEVKTILKRNNLSARESKAGCVRCGACSALPVYELIP
jgi:radical SAM protein (TIGR04043 family)